ncbi:unnamed protein product [Adineta steineri]|uniref:Reverse transcriptase domain-containing protein n=1 Tax=Adineta steineri TaxID=433720 RepID=A0A819JZ40_9BILA|nr:unnamed protein product [Adineta steineri]CAF3937224.1 unnamed protein product [Adineta steineri]
MLMNGLKYIIPCQNRLSRQSKRNKSIEDTYDTISAKVKKCLGDNQTSIKDERANKAFSELKQLISDLYEKPLSRTLLRRARRQHKQIKYLQTFLSNRPDIIICQIDKSSGFYIGDATTIELKAYEYMSTTKACKEIVNGHCPLADNLRSVQTLLQHLLQQKAITKELYDKLYPKMDKLELAHFHGLPKVHKVGIPLRPIIAGIHAPATLTSKFLNNLLAPIYLKVARETTFIHSIDVIKQLETYVDNGYFKSTTRFITADVKNLYTMIPRQGALETLIRFLLKHSNNRKIGTLYIDTILRMARLILDTNCFAYKNNYYQQIHGGAMGSAFTQVLANIYMLEWEQDLIQHQLEHGEIYGRYIDDIFMTTNQSLDDIRIVLEKAKHKDINIEIECTIASTVNYLDVITTNEEGQLKTTVYHKPTAEPYYLPYRSDHPHKYHRNIPYSALTRAARLCSNVHDFNLERLRIEMSLLLGQYPLKMITNEFLRFFQMNKAMPIFQQLNQQAYQELHQQLLNRTTQKETKSNDRMKDPVKYSAILHKKPWDRNKIFLRYLYESGPLATFPKEFNSWWKKYYLFQGSHLRHIKLQLIPKTNSTLARSLIHKKPPRTMLRLSEEPNN